MTSPIRSCSRQRRVAKVCKRQPHVTLALVGCIVHRHQQPLASGALPRKDQKAIPGPVAVPGRCALEQLPVAVAHDRLTQHGKQPVVKLFQPLVDRFLRTSNQMGRDACPAPLELSLVKETQTGGQEREDCRGFMHVRRERGRRPRLVVVFHEAGQLVLIVEPGVEMLAHRPGVPLAEAVVEPFVVGVVESLLLHRPFPIPVDLGHERKFGCLRRTDSVAFGQKSSARMPHVLSNTSGRTSMAMSQRTPSHCPAILSNSPIIASCNCGLP